MKYRKENYYPISKPKPKPTPIEYFKANKENRDAWLKFKKRYPLRAISVSSFVAGYNAAKKDK